MISRRVLGIGSMAVAASAVGTVLWEDRGSRPASRRSLLVGATGAFEGVYKRWADAFTQSMGGGVECTFVEAASQQSLTALKRDSLDMAILARDLSSDDDDELTRSYLVARAYALMLVPKSLGVQSLAKASLRALLRGEARQWSDVGGPAVPVKVVTLPLGTRARGYIESTVLDGREITPAAMVANHPADMVRLVAQDPGAIGYLTSNHPGVRDFVAGRAPAAYRELICLAIDDVAMTRSTVLTGRYLLTRSFYLVTHGAQNLTTRAFVDYARSPEGQAHVADEGMYEAS